MKIKVLIVEDEFTIAMDIEQRLLNLGYSVVGVALNYNEALSYLDKGDINIIILDINLEDEKDGIDLGKFIHDKFQIPVVFLTANTDNETFKKASEAQPMGYLSKPFKDSDIDHSLQLAVNKHRLILENQGFEIATAEYKPTDAAIFIKDKGQLKKVKIEDIIWIEAMDNYTIVHLKNEKYIANTYLKDMIKILGEAFVRIHRSHAVAIDKITSIEDNIAFIGNTYVTISKSYRSDLLKRLKLV